MTIIDAIHRVDGVKPNSYSMDEKLRWLSSLDGIVKKELHDVYLNDVQIEFEGYGENTPLTRELLIPYPYDEIYIRCLEAQIDYANGEYEKYNNSTALFNAAWAAYEKHYHRTHKPGEKGFVHF